MEAITFPRLQYQNTAWNLSGTQGSKNLRNLLITNLLIWWRRGELNPRPKSATDRSLHAYLNSVCDPALAGLSRVRQRRSE